MIPDIIGIIYKPTGVTLTDSEGFEYPEMQAIDGYHVNFPDEVPELVQYKLDPQPATPHVIYAGNVSPVCYAFPDEAEFLSLWTEELAEQKSQEGRDAFTLKKRRKGMRVTRFQALAALHGAVLLHNIESTISASNDPLVRLAWQEASFERLSPFVEQMQSSIGLSDEQLDVLFESAAKIK